MSAILYPISQFVKDSADMIAGFVNAAGDLKITPRFLGAGHFCEGKACILELNGKSGFIDLSGVIVIPPLFQGIGHFHNGLCNIGAGHGVGYIDHAGKWIIQPRFLIAMELSEGRTFISQDGETFRLIDLTGAFIGSDRFEGARPFRAGLAPVMKDERWGFINNRGKVVIPFMFEAVRLQHFKYGLAAARFDGRWGFVDHSGFFAINPVYDDVQPFAEGLAPVKVEEKWGWIDVCGRLRLPPTWEEVGQFVNGLAPARLGSSAGYVNPAGEWAIPPKFSKTERFFGELAVVKIDDAPAYVRVDGKIVWQFERFAIVPRPPLPF